MITHDARILNVEMTINSTKYKTPVELKDTELDDVVA